MSARILKLFSFFAFWSHSLCLIDIWSATYIFSRFSQNSEAKALEFQENQWRQHVGHWYWLLDQKQCLIKASLNQVLCFVDTDVTDTELPMTSMVYPKSLTTRYYEHGIKRVNIEKKKTLFINRHFCHKKTNYFIRIRHY